MCAEALPQKSLLTWKEGRPGGERLRGVGSLGWKAARAGNPGGHHKMGNPETPKCDKRLSVIWGHFLAFLFSIVRVFYTDHLLYCQFKKKKEEEYAKN